jgi:predicted O-methyltransferase YrrM
MYQIKRFNFSIINNNKTIEYKIKDYEKVNKIIDKTVKLKKEKNSYLLNKILYEKNEKMIYKITKINPQNLYSFFFPNQYIEDDNQLIHPKNLYKCDKKYDLITAKTMNYDLIKNKSNNERTELEFDFSVDKIRATFNCLNKDGSIILHFFNLNSKNIKLLHILLLIFEEIILIQDKIFCLKYNPKINKDKYEKYINNIDTISFSKTISLKELNNYELYYSNLFFNIVNNYKLQKYSKFGNNLFDFFLKIDSKYLVQDETEIDLYLYENFKLNRVVNENIHSAVKKTEGRIIMNIIIQNKLKQCLEIGMAFGISSMYITLGLKRLGDGKLISIDPNQSTQWNNYGIKLIKSLGLQKMHELYEDKSYCVLPKLLKEGNKFDFIFIDGWHTFDYTLLDFFYSSLMLNINGIIIIDDIMHRGVSKCIKYLEKNYLHFRRLNTPVNTIGIYKKIRDDYRDWNFHIDF